MNKLAAKLPFSNPSKSYLGWEPKSDAMDLILAEERFRAETQAASVLQRCYRGAAARGGVGKLRRQVRLVFRGHAISYILNLIFNSHDRRELKSLPR